MYSNQVYHNTSALSLEYSDRTGAEQTELCFVLSDNSTEYTGTLEYCQPVDAVCTVIGKVKHGKSISCTTRHNGVSV